MLDLTSLKISTELPVASVAGKKELSDKKRNGVYYTPDRASQILARWAIRQAQDIVLEPSFGGCGFLLATRDRLVELNNKNPELSLFGCDIDSKAFDFLRELLDVSDVPTHFKKIDFLTVRPSDFPAADVVIGNPPYVSRHNMLASQFEAAWETTLFANHTISKKASLWTYFILHSLSFLRPNGRMAWILPGSFIYSEYSVDLRSKLATSFSRCLAVVLEERLFISEGTDENSIILLCEGYNTKSKGEIRIASSKSLDTLEDIIDQWTEGKNVSSSWLERTQLVLAPQDASSCYQELISKAYAHKLGEFADIHIGIVTGATDFFVLTEEKAKAAGLPDKVLEPILSKFAHCRGIQLTTDDLYKLKTEGKRCLLVNTLRTKEISGTLSSYLDSFPIENRIINKTFQKRSIWHQPDNGVRPHAFFSCMQANGPVLVLNEANTTCTNTVYQVNFINSLSLSHQKTIAVSLQSTFSQFSAEIEGRSYGSGALKMEPSEAKKITLLMPYSINVASGAEAAFIAIDEHLRNGDRDLARKTADQFLIEAQLLTEEQTSFLEQGLLTLRQTRRGYRNRSVS